MSRPIVLSNGELHVGLNESGLVSDFYFPYVGQENHTAASGLSHRVGVWVDGEFSWLGRESWQIDLSYHADSLIGRVVAENAGLGIRLEFDDFVDSSQAAFVRNLEIFNCRDKAREIKVFFHQVFIISNSRDSDTVQYVPEQDAIMHYKGHRSFVASARHATGAMFSDYCVGLYGIEGREGTYRDAEDGMLSRNSVEHGMVDSVIGLTSQLEAQDSARIHYWIAAGKSQREAYLIHQRLKDEGVLNHLLATAAYWKEWLTPAHGFASRLEGRTRELFIRSLLTIKSHQDKRGAIIASTDTTMLNYSRDAYAYCWPRDGSFVMWPLIRLGFVDEPLHYFNFCRRALHDGGYLMHKFQSDGSLGSSWHPYVHGSINGQPIQTDETASVLFMFQQYYDIHKDDKILRDYYVTMVRPMANFLAGYVDEVGLPKPSYDLWEEKYLTTTYSTSITYASLLAASELADAAGDADDALRWRTAAEAMLDAAGKFYSHEAGHLIKGYLAEGDDTTFDTTLDLSSLYGAYMFGLFDHDSKEVTDTRQHILDTLSGSEGLSYPRYTNDMYNRIADRPNPWPICSLWMAQYAHGQGDDVRAEALIAFVETKTIHTGILPEQIHPDTGAPISVAPLVWSHAEYVSTLLDVYGSLPEVPHE